MYYKIINQNSEVYKNLYKLRQEELEIEKQNISAIEEKSGHTWEQFLGHSGQQNFRRVTQYSGFKFLEPDKVDLKIWKKDLVHSDIFVPNKRTKLGREMQEFLSNGLKGKRFDKVFDYLNIPHQRSFTFPYVEICDNSIIIFLGQNQIPNDENVIEITKTEFDTLNK